VIYICIPAFDEAPTVGVLLWKIRQVMAEFPRDYQILVLDDGSTDATPAVLDPYRRVLPLDVIRKDQPGGYAAALETLLREAVRRSSYPRRDVIVTMQADFTEQPEEIPTLVKRIESGADIVTSRAVQAGPEPARALRWSRGGMGYLLRRLSWPEPITDPLSGFRAYRVFVIRKALDAADGQPLLRRQGWIANVELLRAVLPFARRADQALVTFRHDRRRRASRFQPWQTLRELLELLRQPVPAAAPDGAAAAGGAAASQEALGEDDAEPVAAGNGGRRRRRGGSSRRRRSGRPRGEPRNEAAPEPSGPDGGSSR
jgi:glycosyltransferase involved in cell wall biosynthesis